MMPKIKLILQAVVTLALAAAFGSYVCLNFSAVKQSLSGNFLIKGLEVQREHVKQKAMAATINHYRPDLSQWRTFIQKGERPDTRFLQYSAEYYEVIGRYAPDLAEARHLLAVCRYLLGQKEQALAEEQKAVELQPRYFWAWYNLGIMEYHNGRFGEAAEAFKRALNLRPELAGRVIATSRVFLEVARAIDAAAVLTPQRTQEGYRDALLMYNASVSRLKGLPPGVEVGSFALRIF